MEKPKVIFNSQLAAMRIRTGGVVSGDSVNTVNTFGSHGSKFDDEHAENVKRWKQLRSRSVSA